MPGAFALPTRALGCPTFGRCPGAWANGRLDSKARHAPTCAATKKSPLPAKGSRLDSADSSAESETVALDASVQSRFKHPLDFRADAQLEVCIADAVVVAGMRDQRSDHVHDVDHALDSRAVSCRVNDYSKFIALDTRVKFPNIFMSNS